MSNPIFILSAERSGSTLLRYVLDSHPEICCPPEVELWRVCRELHTFVSSTLGRVLPAASPEEREEQIWSEVRRMVSQVMEGYARGKEKPIWAEKSPMALLDTDALLHTFPEARYLCLHRHAMDFVHSVLEICKYGWWPQFVDHIQRLPDNTVEALIDYWCDRAERLLAFEAAHPERSLRLTYESLVFETDLVVSRVFEFLQTSFPDDLMDRVFTARHDHGPGDQKIRYTREIDSSNIGKGAAVPLIRVAKRQIERANRLHETLGYPALGEPFGASSQDAAAVDSASSETPQDALATDVGRVFATRIPDKLSAAPELPTTINASFKFVLDDGRSGTWVVDLTGSEGKVVPEDRDATYTFWMKSGTFLAIVNKQQHPFTAFQDGAVRIEGNLLDEALSVFVQKVLQ